MATSHHCRSASSQKLGAISLSCWAARRKEQRDSRRVARDTATKGGAQPAHSAASDFYSVHHYFCGGRKLSMGHGIVPRRRLYRCAGWIAGEGAPATDRARDRKSTR